MNWLSDSTLAHLRRMTGWPELDGIRYRIVESVGEGGMGTVFLAEDRELGRCVALKVLKGPHFDDQAAQRMLKEARIIARLEHPGIVPVHDIGRLQDGRIYYVMKLVRGKRLDEYFDERNMITHRLRVFERICETVSFAHARGVIHRDLKPQNIMVGEFGEVLVLDWGVAKQLRNAEVPSTPLPARKGLGEDDTCPLRPPEPPSGPPLGRGEGSQVEVGQPETIATAYGTIMGTPAYMPPEQARGETDRIDERSDVFALGAILYFLMTGRPPVFATAIDAKRPDEDAIQPLRRLNRTIPRALEAVCMKALAADPSIRYPSAKELGADITRFLGGQAVLAYREGIVERVLRLARTYRTAILLVAAYLLMRMVLLFWAGR